MSISTWYHRQPFKLKISILITLASSVVISVFSTCLIMVEIGVYKKDLLREQLNMLNVVGTNLSAPLVFDDTAAINDTLSVFNKLPDTRSVILLDHDANIVSRYESAQNSNTAVVSPIRFENLSTISSQYGADLLTVQVPIMIDSEVVGAILATTSLGKLHRKIKTYISIACALLPFALILAFILGRIFGRLLSKPIEKLSETMAEVKRTENYNLTADIEEGYELTKLSQAFNEMLEKIKARDELVEYQKQELELQKSKAVQASKSKSEFLANMSHEIRTPMNGVMGMAQVLMRAELPKKETQYAGLIYESGSALMTILNDILDFSKIEAGRLELDPARFDLTETLKGVNALMHNSAKEKGIDLSLNIQRGIETHLIGDAGRIRQILINLIGNAIKFTHEGGVFIHASTHILNNNNRLNITIQDTGIGISKEHLETIFEKFNQADGSITRVFGGTGLGLSITKSLIDAMGGTINVTSELGKGSTFVLTLPLSVASDNHLTLHNPHSVTSAQNRQRETPATSVKTNKVKILVADDNETNLRCINDLLAHIGYQVDAVTNGQMAYNAAKASQYDLILMDMAMPVMDGLESLKAIRAYEASQGKSAVPIVVVTGHALIGDKEAFLNMGFDGYVSKPIESQQILEAIKAAFTPKYPSHIAA
ncbi:MAG: ATP-binding protein [Hellea sp.]